MRTKTILGFPSLLLYVCVPSIGTMSAQNGATLPSGFPPACYFFEGANHARFAEPKGPQEERDYDTSVTEVYRQSCTSSKSRDEERGKAAGLMVQRWRAIWDRDEPFDAAFHEDGAFDLLVLLGITHQLPAKMVNDPQFVKNWIADCSYSCFHIGGDPADPADARFILMQLQLRNDVLDHLKKEPASEPVIEMLEDAKFTLVD